MALASSQRYSGPFVAAANQSQFSIDWPPLGLRVQVAIDGVLLAQNAFSVEEITNGAIITLVAPLLSGKKVEIFGDAEPERVGTFEPNSQFRAANLNEELNILQAQNQEQARDLGRAIKVSFGASIPDLNLAIFEGKLIAVANGNFVPFTRNPATYDDIIDALGYTPAKLPDTILDLTMPPYNCRPGSDLDDSAGVDLAIQHANAMDGGCVIYHPGGGAIRLYSQPRAITQSGVFLVGEGTHTSKFEVYYQTTTRAVFDWKPISGMMTGGGIRDVYIFTGLVDHTGGGLVRFATCQNMSVEALHLYGGFNNLILRGVLESSFDNVKSKTGYNWAAAKAGSSGLNIQKGDISNSAIRVSNSNFMGEVTDITKLEAALRISECDGLFFINTIFAWSKFPGIIYPSEATNNLDLINFVNCGFDTCNDNGLVAYRDGVYTGICGLVNFVGGYMYNCPNLIDWALDTTVSGVNVTGTNVTKWQNGIVFRKGKGHKVNGTTFLDGNRNGTGGACIAIEGNASNVDVVGVAYYTNGTGHEPWHLVQISGSADDVNIDGVTWKTTAGNAASPAIVNYSSGKNISVGHVKTNETEYPTANGSLNIPLSRAVIKTWSTDPITGINAASSAPKRRVTIITISACTLTHGTNFKLKGATNRTAVAGETFEMICDDDGIVWREV